jgi:hypothetical protein
MPVAFGLARMQTLKTLSVVIWGLGASLWVVGAQAGTDEETLAKFEKDYAQMQITKDPKAIAAVSAKIAEDYFFYSPTNGAIATKKALLAYIQQPDNIVTSMIFQPFFIKVFGSTAVVEGVNESTGHYGDRDTSGTFAWMDVFEKRHGHWVWLVGSSGRVDEKLTGNIRCDKTICTDSNRHPGFSLTS